MSTAAAGVLVLAASLAVVHPARAVAGDITTVAGGLGEGAATNVAQTPSAVVVYGPLVYTAEFSVVRVLDLRTAASRVVAGDGRQGFSGDGGPAVAAMLDRPKALAVDAAGNLFVSDAGNDRIRRVGTDGIITTIAGGGVSPDDGVLATAAATTPRGLAFDAAGNLHFADNYRVRRIDAAGRVSTVAGGGTYTGSSDVGDGGPATNALINPTDIAFDPAGNLYMADDWTHGIRRVGVDGVITTFVGGTSGSPGSIAVRNGAVYWAGDQVHRIDPSGTFTRIAGSGVEAEVGDGGPAVDATLRPSDFDFDSDGNLYIADSFHNRLRRVDIHGTITTVAGNGRALFGGDGGPATKARLSGGRIRFDAAGNLFVADLGNNAVRRIDLAGTITTVASANFAFGAGGDIAFDSLGRLYMSDLGGNRVVRLESSGALTVVAGGRYGTEGDGGPATAAAMHWPTALAFDAAGNLLILDYSYVTDHARVRKVDANGIITTVVGPGGLYPEAVEVCSGGDMTLDAAGRILIADDSGVLRFDLAGGVTRVVGKPGWSEQATSGDGGPATDTYFSCPGGVATDAGGNIYLSDPDRQRVRRIDPAGVLSTVAGGGQRFLGDGGPATAARVYLAFGDLALDRLGHLHVVDNTGRIRRVEVPGALSSPTSSSTSTTRASTTTTSSPSTTSTSNTSMATTTTPPVQTQSGLYHPLAPTRILDTRNGTGGHFSPVGPANSMAATVAGVGGVPATGVSAVVLNVTVTQPTAESFLTVYPSGTTRPLASNLNFVANQTVPNLVMAKVGADGKVAVYNHAGFSHVIFDVVGWYGAAGAPDGSRYNPLAPARVLDTRGTGGFGSPVGAGVAIAATVTGVGGVPATGVSAVVLNATVTQPTAQSFLTVFPSGTPRPLASNLNYVANETVPNLVVAKVGADGKVSIYNNAGSSHVILDVVGWYGVEGAPAGSRYNALAPARLLDTRTGTGGFGSPVVAGGTISATVTGVGGVPATGVSAVVLNATVTQPTAPSFLTLFPSGTARPLASNLNFVPNQTVPNLVVAKVGADGKVAVYNNAGSSHVILDVVGWFST